MVMMMNKKTNHILSLTVFLALSSFTLTASARVAVGLDVGTCFVDEIIESGSLNYSCTNAQSGGVGSGAARAEPGFLGASLSKDTPGTPSVFAYSFWFDEVAISSGSSLFDEGGEAYMLTTLLLEGDVTVNDPGSFINIIVEFGINETGGATAEFDLTSFPGGRFSEEISFVNFVNISPALEPELNNLLVMSLTIEGNGSFITDFFGTLSATSATIAKNEDGTDVIDTLDLTETSIGTTLEFNPIPVPAAIWLFGSAFISMTILKRRTSL